MNYDKANYRQYWKDRVHELRTINHSIWGFVGAASLIDCGAKMSNSGVGGRGNYKKFVQSLGIKYADFQYHAGTKDLDIQMYHTFRCGLLHSFSLTTDSQSPADARQKSVVLSSVRDAAIASKNCTLYTSNGLDACQLVLEPFVQDIGDAIDNLFNDPALDSSIEKTYNENPPFNAYAQ